MRGFGAGWGWRAKMGDGQAGASERVAGVESRAVGLRLGAESGAMVERVASCGRITRFGLGAETLLREMGFCSITN